MFRHSSGSPAGTGRADGCLGSRSAWPPHTRDALRSEYGTACAVVSALIRGDGNGARRSIILMEMGLRRVVQQGVVVSLYQVSCISCSDAVVTPDLCSTAD